MCRGDGDGEARGSPRVPRFPPGVLEDGFAPAELVCGRSLPEALLQLGDVTLDRVPMDGVVGRPLLA